MNKQTLFVTLSAAVLVCGCQSSKVKISGRFVGSDAKNVYLEDASPLTQAVIDSAVLAGDGSYRFELKGVPKTPSLYNIIYNGERIPLLIAGGDRVTVGSVGSVVRNYTVEGSAESELLRQFYQDFVTGAQRLDNIAAQFAKPGLTEEERKSLVEEYTAEYYRIRREQLRFIIENKSSLAAVYALYQRLPGDRYLFNGDSDVVYFRTVAEALEKSYPDSPYLQSLTAEIARMDARISLTSQISEAGYPDLEMTDIYGKKIRLYANIGNSKDLASVLQNDAAGIGLFRSEFLYLEKEDFPTEEEQFQVYKKVVETMAGKPVIIRTLDIGADKQCDYFHLKKEENPAMGCRAIRICLTRPEIFKTQLRALFRASAYGNLAIMYPMITSVWEVEAIRKIVEEVKA